MHCQREWAGVLALVGKTDARCLLADFRSPYPEGTDSKWEEFSPFGSCSSVVGEKNHVCATVYKVGRRP